ncbi:hypothetical protein GOBAR_DD16737 [Gossypium barbadense]|nr:hypothetical protein GOBAR_DD16737 [Gossypium barbadense]
MGFSLKLPYCCLVSIMMLLPALCYSDKFDKSTATYYSRPDGLGTPSGACGFGEYGRFRCYASCNRVIIYVFSSYSNKQVHQRKPQNLYLVKGCNIVGGLTIGQGEQYRICILSYHALIKRWHDNQDARDRVCLLTGVVDVAITQDSCHTFVGMEDSQGKWGERLQKVALGQFSTCQIHMVSHQFEVSMWAGQRRPSKWAVGGIRMFIFSRLEELESASYMFILGFISVKVEPYSE